MGDKEPEQKNLWYKDKKFDKFWSHYSKVMMTAHRTALRDSSDVENHIKHSLQKLQLQINPKPNLRNLNFKPRRYRSPACQKRRNKKNQKKRRKNERRLRKNSLNANKINDAAAQLPAQIEESMQLGNCEELEVDEEYLKFIEVTDRHHREWKDQQITNKNLPMQSQIPPVIKEHPDVIRSREMKSLYGENAPRIHAMETAVQLSFDRISTLHSPRHWPEIPFKVLFV